MKKVFIFLIEKYQKYISPLLGNNCRFYPTCSEYTKQAIEKYGVTLSKIRTSKRRYSFKRCSLLSGNWDTSRQKLLFHAFRANRWVSRF